MQQHLLNRPSHQISRRGAGVARLLLTGAATLTVLALLAGCSSTGGRLADGDEIPPDIARIPDAVPKVEPLAKSGNPESYVIKGQRYVTMRSSRGYVDRGLASWYGPYFHGRKTSSGEIYDMRGMSAAHKTLPLPTYVRVTNVENGRSIVVRINDRGPFHGPRLIDLSYTAAVKLGVYRKGTAMVEVRAIDPTRPTSDSNVFLASLGESEFTSTAARRDASRPREKPAATPARAAYSGNLVANHNQAKATSRALNWDEPAASSRPIASPPARLAARQIPPPKVETSRLPAIIPATQAGESLPAVVPAIASRSASPSRREPLYLQIGAFGDPKNAERLRTRLTTHLLADQIRILDPATSGSALYKVRVGPLGSEQDANRVTRELAGLGLETPKLIRN
jgi:rare lipoprotein A